ncbi:DUF2795 domain-containing protein [Candidatus Dojkabacteria bacterium]|nr:DUF2795 domain-containing protein [Candidatus Dojkabacteria bacterium]
MDDRTTTEKKILNSAQDVDNFLNELDYPISKDEIINLAQARGFDPNFISQLNGIPDEEYTDSTDLSDTIGDVDFS